MESGPQQIILNGRDQDDHVDENGKLNDSDNYCKV